MTGARSDESNSDETARKEAEARVDPAKQASDRGR